MENSAAKMSHSHDHSHAIVTPSVYQTLDELAFERGIWFAAQNNDTSRIKELLGRGVHVDSRDNAGYTALHYAARAGHVAVSRQLITAGAMLDAKTRAGEATPLHRAATCGREAVVKLLLESGADSAAVDTDGRTALHRAVEGGHIGVIEMLLKCNPNLKDIKDIKGRLAIEYVGGRSELMSVLS